MKNLFLSVVLLFSGNLYAIPCMDFSGDYSQGDYNGAPVELKIVQNNCDEIELRYIKEGKSQYFKLDEKKVKTFEDTNLGLTSYSTPRFFGNDILIEIENHWADNGVIDKYKRRLHLVFGQTTNLLDQYGDYRGDGAFVPNRQTVYFKK